MAHPYIDTAYIDAKISSTTRTAIGYSSPESDSAIESACNAVDRKLYAAGYDVPINLSPIPEEVKLWTLGQWLALAYGTRKGISIGDTDQALIDSLDKDIASGAVRMLGLAQRTTDGMGGVDFTDTSTETGEPPIFTDAALRRGFL